MADQALYLRQDAYLERLAFHARYHQRGSSLSVFDEEAVLRWRASHRNEEIIAQLTGATAAPANGLS